MKNFLKNRWPDIMIGALYAFIVVFLFVPMFTVVFKDAEGVKTFVEFSLLDFTFGVNRSEISFGCNAILIVAFAFVILSFITYVLAFILKNNEKLSLAFSFVSFISVTINLLSVTFLYAYAKSLNGGLVDLANYSKITIISWSYFIYLFSLVLLALVYLRKVFANIHYTIYEISEIAILTALALVLDKVKIPLGITGGSINLSALPLFIIAIRHGAIKGIVASSVIFGLVSCLLDGYGMQFYPFDYLIAFSGYASVGLYIYLFKKFILSKKAENDNNALMFMMSAFVLGGITSFLSRMVGHTISSIVFYEYTFEAALVYNLPYVSISIIATTIAALLLAKPIQTINKRYPVKKA